MQQFTFIKLLLLLELKWFFTEDIIVLINSCWNIFYKKKRLRIIVLCLSAFNLASLHDFVHIVHVNCSVEVRDIISVL